jgi:hypothetical protein
VSPTSSTLHRHPTSDVGQEKDLRFLGSVSCQVNLSEQSQIRKKRQSAKDFSREFLYKFRYQKTTMKSFTYQPHFRLFHSQKCFSNLARISFSLLFLLFEQKLFSISFNWCDLKVHFIRLQQMSL